MNEYIEREVDFYLDQSSDSTAVQRRPEILHDIDSCFEDRIPKRYRGLTMMAIEESMGIPDQMKAGWEKVRNWIRTRRPGSNLVLAGPVGTGKTTIACGILQTTALSSESRRYGFYGTPHESIWYQSMNTLADMVAASRGHGYAEYKDPMYFLSQAGMLVVDDLGVTPPEGWVQRRIEEILCQRYDEEKTTIITTNLGITSLSSVLAERVVDRLQQTCTFVTLDGSSLRSATSPGAGLTAPESGAPASLPRCCLDQ